MKLPKYFDYATNISTDTEDTLPPLGMLYLISNSKYHIDFIDNRVQKLNTEILYHNLMRYDIVGIGGTIFGVKEARQISIKLMQEGIITIYGGPNATANWNLYINLFNIIVRGEGEEIFDILIENMNNYKNLEKYGFSRSGQTYINNNVYRIGNLDELTFPDRKAINIHNYRRKEPAYLDRSPVDTVVSSRGCPYDCYFCSSKYIWQRKYSYRSIDNILQEIEYLKINYGTRSIYFREDNFTVKRERVLEFCHKVSKFNMPWLCESRIDTLDEPLIKDMANSGCKGIWFGIESTDDRVLKKIGKGITLEQIKTTVNLCEKYGIRTGGGFMLGFPFDSKDSMIKNYEDSQKLNLSVTFYNRVWAIPVSEMYHDILNQNLDYYSFENIILPSTIYLSADEVNRLYFKLVSKRQIIDKTLSKILGSKISQSMKEKFPRMIAIYRYILNKI
jgi:radical SAM superfamily enzyme YgiQ (UPF0313 family)